MGNYDWQDKRKVEDKKPQRRPVASCRVCGSAGYSGGLCQMHFDKRSEDQHIQRLKTYRNSDNEIEIDNMISLIKTKMLAHPVPAEQEEGDE